MLQADAVLGSILETTKGHDTQRSQLFRPGFMLEVGLLRFRADTAAHINHYRRRLTSGGPPVISTSVQW
jgi:hypothetical protein